MPDISEEVLMKLGALENGVENLQKNMDEVLKEVKAVQLNCIAEDGRITTAIDKAERAHVSLKKHKEQDHTVEFSWRQKVLIAVPLLKIVLDWLYVYIWEPLVLNQ